MFCFCCLQKHMEGEGRMGLSPTDEDSAYDSPKSTENSLSPTTPPKSSNSRLISLACGQCGRTLRDPRCLPCLHSFCLHCLQVKNKKVICPECRLETPLPSNGLSGLLPDYGIINFLRSLKLGAFCTSCKSETLHAVAKCINCDSLLCSNCLMAHSFMHCFSGHRVIEFPKCPELGEGPKDDTIMYCLIHPTEVVKYFCYPCSELMCQLCSDESHYESNHIMEELHQIGSGVISLMADKVAEGKCQAEDFAVCIRYNQQTLFFLQNQYHDIHNKINQIYEQHSALLAKYKEQQLTLLDGVYERMISALRMSTKVSEESYDRLTHLTDFFSRLIKYGNTPQCLMYKKILETELANLSAIKAKPVSCNLRLESEGGTDYASTLIRTFGRVIYELNGINNENYFVNDCWSKIDQPVFPFKYEKWSNSCFDELKAISDLNICDSNQSLRSFHLKSNVTRMTITYNWKFGSYGSMQGQFTEPNGVCINSEGDIIVADTNNNRVQVFDRSGKFKFSFGDGNNCSDGGALLFPNRVAVMEKSGDIVVTERAPTHQVQVYNQYGQFIRKFGANVLQHPRAVAVDKDGHIIVVECKVMRVIIFDMMGNIKHKFTCNDTLHFPNGVAVNDKQEIFISDNRTHCVVVYNYHGKQLRTIGHEGLTNYPIGVMLNKAGHVIVADNHNNFNLTVFTQDGQFLTAVESKVKHAQCYDAAISSDGTVALTSKDYRVYVYLTSF